MFETNHEYSTVTAVLPERSASRVLQDLTRSSDLGAWLWKARGTLLQDRWLQRFVPPVSPTKSMFQLLVPNPEVEDVVRRVIDESNLHLQATGAVFSTPCDHVYFGSQFKAWRGAESQPTGKASHEMRENLSVIYCVVAPRVGEKIAKAAINQGAHGPIVYYSEGRGLRDRIGWLRITKEVDKEVVMVLADEADVEQVFDAMAKAGELHLPGRGFMYRLAIDKGMFNLPSRMSNHHYAANVQQIISAIDNLAGHSHWRDQPVLDVGRSGKALGVPLAPALDEVASKPSHQVCVSAIVARDHGQALSRLLLAAGAPGLNLHHSRFVGSGPLPTTAEGHAGEESGHIAGATIEDGYSFMRCITHPQSAERICAAINKEAEAAGIHDIAVLTNEVPRVATYVPDQREFRHKKRKTALVG